MLFRRKIERSCSYCRHGIKVDETTCLCTKKGLVALDGACRRFRYEPLKRVPKVGKDIVTPDGTGVIVEINAIRERVKVRIRVGDDDSFEVREYSMDDVRRLGPEDQPAVFDRYFHTTANTKHDSTGLGLTIAQELARLHHGEILLESEVGKGSCFTLKLPLLAD